MKKTILFFAVLFATHSLVSAQIIRELKKVIELNIPREGGANGASVAWNPVQKKYYAAMAGNVEFSLSVYDIDGKRISPAEQKALFDVRGLWYNPSKKTIQVNGYNDFGWGEYVLDKNGLPEKVNVLHEGMHQPDAQSVGSYDPARKSVYFYNLDGHIERYDPADGNFKETIELFLGRTGPDDDILLENAEVVEEYNRTTLVFTGLPKAEIGLYNHHVHEIELYDIKTGYITRKLSLPQSAPAPEYLNFSYCNGIFWLFDKESRIWKGYK